MSDGVKDREGQTVLLTAQVYFNPENNCQLYDINISNIWFKQDGVTLYTQPDRGECDVYVKVVNSSKYEKTAVLRIFAESNVGNVRILSEQQINLSADAEIEKGYQVSFSKGEKINAVIVQ